jgi:glutathionyl-hydroquinone reductase
MGLGMLVKGEWLTEREQEDQDGQFIRPSTTFRQWVKSDNSTPFTPDLGRYHLYISWACPWAHRTAIMRSIKGLEAVISLSVVDPVMGDEGWAFSTAPGAIPDDVNDASYLREIYLKAEPNFTGRVTVPILWDRSTKTIVNNESREILRMLDQEFNHLGENPVNLCPSELRSHIDQVIDEIYQPINNGVYRAGFATQQKAYEEAVRELFEALDHWEGVLARQRYLCGDRLTEADICMFTTLLRFDAVYYSHFKCNIRRIFDYPNLWNYLKDIYQYPGVQETCHLDHIKQHYYRSHPNVNPTGIVPVGPELDFSTPHDRDRF